MKNVVICAVIMAMLCSVSAFAGSSSYAPQKVKKILQYGKYAVIELNAEANTQSCTRNSGGEQKRVGFSTRTEDGKVFLANLLTAFGGDKTVVVGVNGCVPYGTHTIPRVYRLELIR